MGKRWTQEEQDFVRANAHKYTDVELAKRLSEFTGREISFSYTRKLRQRSGIRKLPGRGVCVIDSSSLDDVTTETVILAEPKDEDAA